MHSIGFDENDIKQITIKVSNQKDLFPKLSNIFKQNSNEFNEEFLKALDNNKIKNYSTIESEIADVFIVLCIVCNKLGIDLFTAFKEKEKEDINRKWEG